MRRFTPIELAIGFALAGSVAAVAVPTCAREVHASRLVEPTEGLARLAASAVECAERDGHFPSSVALTPAVPPRGKKEVDAPGTWDAPTWQTLGFRASPEGVPHAYAFAFDGRDDTFVARARGDLDGDGILSTFEVRGQKRAEQHAEVLPGMYVEAELE